jgi:hypothetical protein
MDITIAATLAFTILPLIAVVYLFIIARGGNKG